VIVNTLHQKVEQEVKGGTKNQTLKKKAKNDKEKKKEYYMKIWPKRIRVNGLMKNCHY